MTKGWQTKRLGDACRFIDYRGKTPGKTTSGLRLITAKNVKMGYIQETPMEFVDPKSYDGWMTRGIPKIGDVLFTTEAPLANVAQLDTEEKVVFAQQIIVLQPAENDLDRTFLKYLLLSDLAQRRIHEKGTGATVKGIKASLLKSIPIEFPPLPEQHRIVGILDEAFDGLATATANAEMNLQNARSLFESHLQSVFTQPGKGWEEKSVGDLVADRLLAPPIDGNHGEIHPKKADFVSSGVPFIMASDLEDGRVNQRDCAFISRKQADSLRKGFAEDGDVLLSHKGTIGRVAILHTKHDYVMLTPQVTYYRVIAREKFLNRFLYYALQSTNFVQRMNEIAGAGSTRAYIGILKQLELPIAFPVLAEQERLANQLDALAAETQRLESIYQQKLAALGELKKSLLHQAFSGGL